MMLDRRASLTPEQRSSFEDQGFLLIEGAISASEVVALSAWFDELWTHRSDGEYLHQADFIRDNPIAWGLLDNTFVLPAVVDLLGWNIYVYTCHLDVNAPVKSSEHRSFWDWHLDSPQIDADLEPIEEIPMFSLKAAYWLSDVSEPGRGNTYVLPGSHRFPGGPPKVPGPLEGSIPLICQPGDCVLLHRRLWHTRSPNSSEVLRKAAFIGYGFRWLRSRTVLTHDLPRTGDPVRDQLLGAPLAPRTCYHPDEDSAPLKRWATRRTLPR